MSLNVLVSLCCFYLTVLMHKQIMSLMPVILVLLVISVSIRSVILVLLFISVSIIPVIGFTSVGGASYSDSRWAGLRAQADGGRVSLSLSVQL